MCWLTGKLGALRPEGRMFEFHSSRHVQNLGKSFTHSVGAYLLSGDDDAEYLACCALFGVLTLTQYQCRERL